MKFKNRQFGLGVWAVGVGAGELGDAHLVFRSLLYPLLLPYSRPFGPFLNSQPEQEIIVTGPSLSPTLSYGAYSHNKVKSANKFIIGSR